MKTMNLSRRAFFGGAAAVAVGAPAVATTATIGFDLSTKPDQTVFAYMTEDGMYAVPHDDLWHVAQFGNTLVVTHKDHVPYIYNCALDRWEPLEA